MHSPGGRSRQENDRLLLAERQYRTWLSALDALELEAVENAPFLVVGLRSRPAGPQQEGPQKVPMEVDDMSVGRAPNGRGPSEHPVDHMTPPQGGRGPQRSPEPPNSSSPPAPGIQNSNLRAHEQLPPEPLTSPREPKQSTVLTDRSVHGTTSTKHQSSAQAPSKAYVSPPKTAENEPKEPKKRQNWDPVRDHWSPLEGATDQPKATPGPPRQNPINPFQSPLSFDTSPRTLKEWHGGAPSGPRGLRAFPGFHE